MPEVWTSEDGETVYREVDRLVLKPRRVVYEDPDYDNRDYRPRPYPPVVLDRRLNTPKAIVCVAVIAAITALLIFGTKFEFPFHLTWDGSRTSSPASLKGDCDATQERFVGYGSDGVPQYRLEFNC